jgi:transcriptional regulator with XRE-family HTH domain
VKILEVFRRNIRGLLHSTGKSQGWLGDELGMSDGVVSSLLNGKTSLKAEHIQRAAEAFGISPSELLADAPPQPRIIYAKPDDIAIAAAEVAIRSVLKAGAAQPLQALEDLKQERAQEAPTPKNAPISLDLERAKSLLITLTPSELEAFTQAYGHRLPGRRRKQG